ncbi:MAG TPA: acetoacetate--CoA ligase [Gemmatimonadaceae bacterium]
MTTIADAPLWTPGAARVARAQLGAFARRARELGASVPARQAGTEDYAALHRWSVAHPVDFWSAVWEFCGVIADRAPRDLSPAERAIGLDRMAPPDAERGPRWFPGARLNFAENLLRHGDAREALVFWNEQGRGRALTYAELRAEVARAAAGLRALGIGAGDRVAGYLPNLPETVVAMLAATSIGAIWSSCSPDFGASAVIDRFGQIEPRVLVCADGYQYAGKRIDCLPRVREIAAALPSVERVVVVPYLGGGAPADTLAWRDLLALGGAAAEPRYERLPFDHPVYILYSSGTTGLPKCMVHGAGGTLLQHLKEHILHVDLRREDRIFYFTTCGWMMWNWLVSALAVGATVVLYDGAPVWPRVDVLWTMAERERLTVFGTSAKYLALLEKAGAAPARTYDLAALRAILSTGSPLAPQSFDYVYRDIKSDVHLASISGGTDIVSCFVLGNPTAPVWRGEIQCAGLGMAVEVRNADGARVVGEAGELVCTRPFPSMPVAFWNDPGGERYRDAYFARWPGVWRHGDWAEETAHGGFIIHGRSDATLNPGGVRIGTAEIYRQVEQIDEVLESVVVGHALDPEDEGDVRIVLFVRLREGTVLDDALRTRIRRRIRENASPHHVPKVIVQVSDIPRTISGKISELAVRAVIHGRPVENADALANPSSLDLFRDIPELSR